MREEVDCVQQDEGMDEEPRNDQEPGDSSVVFVRCRTDLTLADLNELALSAATKKLKPPRHN